MPTVRVFNDFNDLPTALLGGALSIGNFDGFHIGHARIVQRLTAQARAVGGPAVVLTFDPHPAELLGVRDVSPPLTRIDRKCELLEEAGVDAIVVYPTDGRLLAMTPAEFFHEIVRRTCDARAMVEGPNFCFGRGRIGDIGILGDLCEDTGVTLEIVEPLCVADRYVSSSRIRELISEGDVARAREQLGRPHRIRGKIVRGAGRGAKIGFPTANMAEIDTLLPATGAYVARAHTADGSWPAAASIGSNPTFGEGDFKVEVFLIGFHGSLYGESLALDFLTRLRDIRPFDSVEELQAQLARDVEKVSSEQ